MTKAEYQKAIAELCKKRNFYENEVLKLEEEMNNLQIDEEHNEMLKGEYVLMDHGETGYKIYFHVDSWERTHRGALLQGKGFYNTAYGLQTCDKERIFYEEEQKNYKYTIITKEEFEKAFESAIEDFRIMFENR